MSREVCGQCNGEVTDIGCHCEPTQVNEIERLRAENAALRADAERYRWLRGRISGREYRRLGILYGEPNDVDTAIDAARKV